eukprot:COSAG02_NODE_1340_length_13187_cov_6.960804_9_plen_103_part_00
MCEHSDNPKTTGTSTGTLPIQLYIYYHPWRSDRQRAGAVVLISSSAMMPSQRDFSTKSRKSVLAPRCAICLVLQRKIDRRSGLWHSIVSQQVMLVLQTLLLV